MTRHAPDHASEPERVRAADGELRAGDAGGVPERDAHEASARLQRQRRLPLHEPSLLQTGLQPENGIREAAEDPAPELDRRSEPYERSAAGRGVDEGERIGLRAHLEHADARRHRGGEVPL